MMDFEWRLSIDTVQLSSWLSIQFQAPRFKSWISRSNSFKERPPTLEPSPPPQCILKSVPCLFMNLLTTSVVIEFYILQWHCFNVTAPIYQRSRFLAIGLFLVVRSANHDVAACDTMLCHIIISAVHACLKLHITEITGSIIFYH